MNRTTHKSAIKDLIEYLEKQLKVRTNHLLIKVDNAALMTSDVGIFQSKAGEYRDKQVYILEELDTISRMENQIATLTSLLAAYDGHPIHDPTIQHYMDMFMTSALKE